MLKKTMVMFMSAVVMLCLVACSSASVEETTTISEEASEDDSIIEFDDTILFDEGTVTVELINFYAEDVNWTTGSQNEKHVTFKVTNNADHEIRLDEKDFYINDEICYVCGKSDTIDLAPGKSGTYIYIIAYDTAPEHTALETLDELYYLEGTFTGTNLYDDSKNSKFEIEFSIQEAIGNDVSQDNIEESQNMLALNEKSETEKYGLTLVSVSYDNIIDEDNFSRPFARSESYESAEDGMTYMLLSFEYENLDTNDVELSHIDITVTYEDKYTYTTSENFDAWITEDIGNGLFRRYSNALGYEHYVLDLSPLQSRKYITALPVAETIGEDETPNLTIIFSYEGCESVYGIEE